jgi:hypothetical protein
MKRLLSLAFGIFALICPPAHAEEARMSEAEASALKLSLNRGLDLRRHDQAAWHSTDTLLKDVKKPALNTIRGWVVTNVPDGLLVTYWRPESDGFRGVYSAVWTGSEIQDRQILDGAATLLSDQQVELIKAQQQVDTSQLQRCSDKPFNSVVLPPASPGEPILVYMLTPQTIATAVPMGGHYRFSVLDGRVIDQRAFTKSCIELPFKHDKAKGTPEGLFITHLLDPVPTEIHVFSVYAARVPIYVSTVDNEHIWVAEISGGDPRVRLIK